MLRLEGLKYCTSSSELVSAERSGESVFQSGEPEKCSVSLF